ncbi:hypothetical protein TGME49_262840 [Toxoplasma gondii ME49]|uniref:Uncharacterized protein n=2 Tax=Toxoplasma gondii TaxID=5811 RepID=S8GMA6_TOXGM|nr:hypothetical protein TGME49_262840 [Toxoplasma gondii ME49]EPT29674.1 hypothetical protein TGME49_262840 [Toxoplasma gondii ME49]KYF40712.1 hypothetical protein TGARI_262840 [Toxoplasma gondii ARI]|eukprot:XP_002365384.1 hypothetical protein TGME49_262840 [Toxoplasma gondii ME49]
MHKNRCLLSALPAPSQKEGNGGLYRLLSRKLFFSFLPRTCFFWRPTPTQLDLKLHKLCPLATWLRRSFFTCSSSLPDWELRFAFASPAPPSHPLPCRWLSSVSLACCSFFSFVCSTHRLFSSSCCFSFTGSPSGLSVLSTSSLALPSLFPPFRLASHDWTLISISLHPLSLHPLSISR